VATPCEPLSEVPIHGEPEERIGLIEAAIDTFDSWTSRDICLSSVELADQAVTGEEYFGEYYPNRKLARVVIGPEDSDAEITNTMWHELCHAADHGLSDAYAALWIGAIDNPLLETDPYEDFAYLCAYGPDVLRAAAQEECDQPSILVAAVQVLEAEVFDTEDRGPLCP